MMIFQADKNGKIFPEMLGGEGLKTALVVDDDSYWRRIFSDMLQERGFKVYHASDGVEGITKAIKYKPDLVVVDYILPKVNGTYVVRFLRSNPAFKNAGIVLVSFSDDLINEYWAQEYGADLFIKKIDGPESAQKKMENFLIVEFSSEKNLEVLSEKETVEMLLNVIDEELRKEKINRDFLELVERVDDESYVMRRIWNMLLKFVKIESMYVMLVTPSMGRIYAFSARFEPINHLILKEKLLGVLRKPVTPSDWRLGGNVRFSKEGEEPVLSYHRVIEKREEELGVLAFEGLDKAEKRKLVSLLKDTHGSLSVLFRTMNLFWDYKIAADVDALTGLLVKKVVLSKLEEYTKLLSRQGVIFSVAMLDIDDFKKVNDTYGHVKGDEVLEKIGEIISSTIRETDVAGRYGGEEFLIIFPGSGEDEAKAAVERILEGVRNFDWQSLGVGKLTMSAGVAQAREGMTVTEIIEMADKALYEAKRSGKNRCVIYKGGGPS